MKKILCKFANWILRKCTGPDIAFGKEIYINGRTYTLIQATREIKPYSTYRAFSHVTMELEG